MGQLCNSAFLSYRVAFVKMVFSHLTYLQLVFIYSVVQRGWACEIGYIKFLLVSFRMQMTFC